MQTASTKLAFFCHNLSYSYLTEQTINRVKGFFLDYLGIVLHATQLDSSRSMRRFIQTLHAQGDSTAIGLMQPTSLYWAALANGTAAHSLEFDDAFPKGSIHNECFLYSTACAQAEENGANGKEFIEAIVVGFEVACRLAEALQPALTNARGFHPTGVCGVVGAAVTAGKLIKLNVEQMVSAIGIATSQASGLLEFIREGAWTKRLHAGWAAHAGLVAANLAKEGFTGPTTAIEGQFGFLHAYSGNPLLSVMDDGLGEDYRILQTAIKFYPCNYYIQAAVEATLNIVCNHSISPEQIASIEVYALTAGFPLVCEPRKEKDHPHSLLDAQFSLPFNIAIAILKKRVTLNEYTEENFSSEDVQRILKKMTCIPDVELDAYYPADWPARIVIVLEEGKRLESEVKIPKGDPRRPLTQNELIFKHKNLVKGILNEEEINKLIDFVLNLEKQPHLHSLGEILRCKKWD